MEGRVVGRIGPGLLALVGVEADDTEADARYIAEKTASLRIFTDAGGKMNLSVLDIKGGILVISQFTLHGDCRRGRRPSFTTAAQPDLAIPLYERVAALLEAYPGLQVARGVFGAHMTVSLTNDGPVTLILDSRKRF